LAISSAARPFTPSRPEDFRLLFPAIYIDAPIRK
jgi:hypothetical protein